LARALLAIFLFELEGMVVRLFHPFNLSAGPWQDIINQPAGGLYTANCASKARL
jgi:hypothetical protein